MSRPETTLPAELVRKIFNINNLNSFQYYSIIIKKKPKNTHQSISNLFNFVIIVLTLLKPKLKWQKDVSKFLQFQKGKNA